MQYQELHQRYGSHIAKRVQAELDNSEFSRVELEKLTSYLETRAETAHKEYQGRLVDPLDKAKNGTKGKGVIDLLHRRWRDAEEISYLVTVAEDVSLNIHTRMAAD